MIILLVWTRLSIASIARASYVTKSKDEFPGTIHCLLPYPLLTTSHIMIITLDVRLQHVNLEDTSLRFIVVSKAAGLGCCCEFAAVE